jgi:hypothetical protein
VNSSVSELNAAVESFFYLLCPSLVNDFASIQSLCRMIDLQLSHILNAHHNDRAVATFKWPNHLIILSRELTIQVFDHRGEYSRAYIEMDN